MMMVGVCVAISVWWKRSRNKHKRGSRPLFPVEESLCETRHQMMGTATIRDMIELTTSGSGSGEYVLCNVRLKTIDFDYCVHLSTTAKVIQHACCASFIPTSDIDIFATQAGTVFETMKIH